MELQGMMPAGWCDRHLACISHDWWVAPGRPWPARPLQQGETPPPLQVSDLLCMHGHPMIGCTPCGRFCDHDMLLRDCMVCFRTVTGRGQVYASPPGTTSPDWTDAPSPVVGNFFRECHRAERGLYDTGANDLHDSFHHHTLAVYNLAYTSANYPYPPNKVVDLKAAGFTSEERHAKGDDGRCSAFRPSQSGGNS